MKETREPICYWYERARDNFYGPRARRSETYRDCMYCNGHDKECKKYYEIIKVWPMQHNTTPHEDTHPVRRKQLKDLVKK